MQVGILTARFDPSDWPLERIAVWASENGIDCLEIAVPQHFDPATSGDRADRAALHEGLRARGLTISSLACYSLGINDPDPGARQEHIDRLLATIDAAEDLGVDTVCALAGAPAPGKSKMQTIREDLPEVFGPVLEHAGRHGVRIALENWYATNIQHLEHWRALFEVLPQENFGLNFDPSHLAWQQIDYFASMEEFADRIFHTHAKDVSIDDAKLRDVGVLDDAWHRYSIPGTGRIPWGEYFRKLREIGFDGAVSIEHEDGTLGAEEGFRMAAEYMRPLMG